ncbi:MAG: LPS export ABC transporter periplasmic protein LptC [Bdellovibrionaceae bacterium]|nr:LPS export ABC transporter periplasmic protein LptC [Pseudobdellovibrionaceae bacterium]
MKKTRTILFSLLLLFILVEVIFIFPQQIEKMDREAYETTTEQKKERVEQKMDGVHLVETQKGSRDWELFAEKARGYQDGGDWFLNKVKVQFYNLEANDFTVTGNEGEIDGHTKNIKIKGNVVTKSANGYTFFTDEIFYNSQLRKIISPGKIKMLGPSDDQGEGLKLDGYNMHILVDINEMKIFKDITAIKNMKSNQNLKITSEMATFSGKSKEAHFENNVMLNYGSMLIRGPDCFFIYSSNMRSLERINVKGGVELTDKKRRATSQDLVVDLYKTTLRFTGNPKIYQDQDEISGEEILLLDGGKRLKIQKVKANTDSI